MALLSVVWATESGRLDDARTALQDAVEAGLARMPLPDAHVLLQRVAHHAQGRGAAYLEARALELAGSLVVDSPASSVELPAEIPGILVEDPADLPTDVMPLPDLNG